MRLEMMQVARLAPRLLGESTELVRRFLVSRQNPDGGFRGRSTESDLYYTVFALDSLLSLQAAFNYSSVAPYLESQANAKGLDFVHLCCLARVGAALEQAGAIGNDSPKPLERLGERLGRFRSKDGGFNLVAGAECGTAYGCFLGCAACQDLRTQLAEPGGVAGCLAALETSDGAWANERGVALGSTNATAAAVTVLRDLSWPVKPSAGEWLLARCHPLGGFLAATQAPLPDLLSTATALHALAGLQADLLPVRERCLDFVDSLWTNEGAFHAHWADSDLDCEYVFYGLLALGHLSLGR